jgi:PTS system mannitol-specific IIC component
MEESDLMTATSQMADLKGRENITRIAFACDAGMGSSAMGASALKNKFKKAGINIEVFHCSLEDIPKDTRLVVTHKDLAQRAKKAAPRAEVVTIQNFIGAPEYDKLVEKFKK